MVALVKPSVVAITVEVAGRDIFNRPFTQEGAGSGWIVDESGIIVTNNHVVETANNITVTLDDGRTFTADASAWEKAHGVEIGKLHPLCTWHQYLP